MTLWLWNPPAICMTTIGDRKGCTSPCHCRRTILQTQKLTAQARSAQYQLASLVATGDQDDVSFYLNFFEGPLKEYAASHSIRFLPSPSCCNHRWLTLTDGSKTTIVNSIFYADQSDDEWMNNGIDSNKPWWKAKILAIKHQPATGQCITRFIRRIQIAWYA